MHIIKKTIKDAKEMKPAKSLIKFLITISNPKNNKILLKIAKNLFNNIKNVLFILQTSNYTYL